MNPCNYNLCIGGPWDGKLTAQEDGRGFFDVPVLSEIPPISSMPDVAADAPVDIKRVRYVFDYVRTPTGCVAFWRPEDQTTFDTLTALLIAYHDRQPLCPDQPNQWPNL